MKNPKSVIGLHSLQHSPRWGEVQKKSKTREVLNTTFLDWFYTETLVCLHLFAVLVQQIVL